MTFEPFGQLKANLSEELLEEDTRFFQTIKTWWLYEGETI